MKKLQELSFFFPVYNLENQVAKTVAEAVKVIPSVAEKYEIIAVNDGSGDNTGEVLSKLEGKYENLRVITHTINRGYGAALKTGFYKAKYNWIGFCDGDGQFDVNEVGKLIDCAEKTKADLVIGYYKKRQVSRSIILTSKMWEALVFILFGLKVKDIDCGFKLIKKRVFDTIPHLESERGAFISSELLVKAKKAGFKISEVGVTHLERKEDVRSATGRSIKVIVRSFLDLLKLWFKLRK